MPQPPNAQKSSRLLRLLFKSALWGIGGLLLAAIALGFFMKSERGQQWSRKLVHDRFPDVQMISPLELREWLDSALPQPLLIDARSAEEQQVSTLPGAVRVSAEASAAQVLAGQDSQRAIVVYCSSGYRGATMAQRLSQAGCPKVQNLEGGITAWARAGYPLVSNGIPTTEVKVQGSVFARMLKRKQKDN